MTLLDERRSMIFDVSSSDEPVEWVALGKGETALWRNSPQRMQRAAAKTTYLLMNKFGQV